MKTKYTLLILYFILLYCNLSAIASDSSAHSLFFEANKAFRQEDYETAIENYKALINLGITTGDVFYNIGNSYFRMGQTGWAILYYERAKMQMPDDADLDFNLRYANDQVSDKLEKKSSFYILSWLENFSLSYLFWIFIFINFFFWALLIIRRFIRSEWTYYLLLAFSIFWSISGLSLCAKWYEEVNDYRAVVVAEEITVRAGPDETDTALFNLHSGTIVKCERNEGNWRLIQFTPEKRGWTEADSVIPINIKF